MTTAEVARKNADVANRDIDKILREINDASKRGLYEIWVKRVSPFQVMQLQRLGYKVTREKFGFGSEFLDFEEWTISWR